MRIAIVLVLLMMANGRAAAEPTAKPEPLEAAPTASPSPGAASTNADVSPTASSPRVDPAARVAIRPTRSLTINPVESACSDFDPDRKRRRNGAIAFAAGAGLMVASLTLTGLNIAYYYINLQDNDRDGANRNRHIIRYAGTGTFLGGAALAGLGAYWYLSSKLPGAPRTAIAPAVGDGGFGLAISGGF